MTFLRACWAVAGVFGRYFLYKLGLRSRPPRFEDAYGESARFFGAVLGWDRLRLVHPERCAQGHPVIYAGNHTRLDDPAAFYGAILRAQMQPIVLRIMMRDDYFSGGPWRWIPLNINEILEMAGGAPISRDRIHWAQLKPFLQTLEAPGSFLMFPGRSRSRTGILIEYRDGVQDFGAASFFAAQAQRRNPGVRAAIQPLVRTWHPVRRESAIVFGSPLALAPGAGRAAQRALDHALAVQLGELVELNAPQVISALLYLHCLHRRPPGVAVTAIAAALARILDSVDHPYRDPAALERPEEETKAFAEWLAARRAAGYRAGVLWPDASRILEAPPADTRYRKRNPVKYLANQILHLPEVVRAIEACPLEAAADQPPAAVLARAASIISVKRSNK